MREILTDITTSSGGGKVAVMYFDDSLPADPQTAAVLALWNGVRPQVDGSVTFAVRNQGRLMDEATGQVTGFWSGVGYAPVTGSGTGQSVADATQVLVQWRTGVVRNGREVRGRTFIPGLNAVNLDNGNIGEAYRAAIELEADEFLTSTGIGFGIWSRPKPGSAGALIQVTSVSVWKELAVLRRRRG